jgi:DNA-directed RNA polymerase I subunit RPA2
VAERLNWWRYVSHYRSIHRGAFFAQLRTTTVRKLLPDSWGFLCPVHTPDGSPCGLLNHLTSTCHVAITAPNRDELAALVLPQLASAGAVLLPHGATLPSTQYLPVLLDAQLVARVHLDAAEEVAAALRQHKVTLHAANLAVAARGGAASRAEEAAASLEIALFRPLEGGLFPGLFLYSGAARFQRAVRNVTHSADELIGPLEQTTLRIAYAAQDLKPGESTHVELSQTGIFSLVASLTPLCDFNQSPRNMYQCQMGKQTMGTPYHSHTHRVDTKVYRLHTPQSPIVRNANYDKYAMDEYASGANAVVAVCAYTGYDMEDAMIINKQSYERGFGHGSVYTVVTVDLATMKKKGEPLTLRFGNRLDSGAPPTPPDGEEGGAMPGEERLFEPKLGVDGFPSIGTVLHTGDPLVCHVDEATGRHTVKRHKSAESATVEEVRMLGSDSLGNPCEKATIKLRYRRNPVPGDKFSSRHGQKGVMSRLWPAEDMPFTESGMVPDILFNPHGFPSRMTIGMLLESMAGKAGAAHAIPQDGSPFRFSEKHRAVDHFGEQLRAAGYAYHGTESMYSGVYGTEMEVQIFVGVVYYQRLRHMVSDKDQVRAKGPIQQLTRQPVHGRKVRRSRRLKAPFGEAYLWRRALLRRCTAGSVWARWSATRCSPTAPPSSCRSGCCTAPTRRRRWSAASAARSSRR